MFMRFGLSGCLEPRMQFPQELVSVCLPTMNGFHDALFELVNHPIYFIFAGTSWYNNALELVMMCTSTFRHRSCHLQAEMRQP